MLMSVGKFALHHHRNLIGTFADCRDLNDRRPIHNDTTISSDAISLGTGKRLSILFETEYAMMLVLQCP